MLKHLIQGICKMRGEYILWPEEDRELIIPNSIVQDGMPGLLAMMLQADVSQVAAGGNFYMGLCTDNTPTHTLATLVGEPTGNGYARQPITRNAAGWPLIEIINSNGHARSSICTFVCSGSNYNVTVSNVFLCNAASGSSGKLYSCSATFPTPIQLAPGQTIPVQFDLYVN